jgi:hypothetical protein
VWYLPKHQVLQSVSKSQKHKNGFSFLYVCWTNSQSLFPLPSRRTLQTSLNTVHYRTGINVRSFSTHRRTLLTMSDENWMCCLICDEMSERTCVSIRSLAVLRALIPWKPRHDKQYCNSSPGLHAPWSL